MESFNVVSHGTAVTARVASIVAGRLFVGDVVLLKGGLASGKTTFVKAVASALNSSDLVTSPTFSLAQFYSSDAGAILHIDTYRLTDIREYRDLGLDEYTETCITLVEWGERVAADFPCHLLVEFRVDPDETDLRELAFSSECDRWTPVLAGLHNEIMSRAS